MTYHAIPDKDLFLQRHSRAININCNDVNGVSIYRPKDQSKFLNRTMIFVESNFPTIFYFLKYKAVKFLIKKKD